MTSTSTPLAQTEPFRGDIWKQFGGGPTPADYERMNPAKARTFEAGRAKAKAK